MSEVDHAGPTTTDKLVHMANGIGRFFATQKGGTAVLHTADHIKSFWTANMFRDVFAHLDKTGGKGLEPVALDAIIFLREAPTGAIRTALAAAGEPSSRAPGNDAG